MARTGKFAGVPEGWCWRPATSPGDKGLRVSQVNVDSLRNVYRRKDLIITYGCRKGMWHPGGKYRVKKKGKWVVSEGRCDKGGIRAVRIMKPKSKVLKSRHRRDYECRKG